MSAWDNWADVEDAQDEDDRCFDCGQEPCVCPPEQCPECGERCASLCIDDTCRRGECCCFHVEKKQAPSGAGGAG